MTTINSLTEKFRSRVRWTDANWQREISACHEHVAKVYSEAGRPVLPYDIPGDPAATAECQRLWGVIVGADAKLAAARAENNMFAYRGVRNDYYRAWVALIRLATLRGTSPVA